MNPEEAELNPTDNPSRIARSPQYDSWASTATMIVFTAIAAVISYNDGLYLIRFMGAAGQTAYLYPTLPDGLILISSIRLYRAAPQRPGWAMTGVILGIGLTLAMNVGAGILHDWMYALADACVPVVFFVALEILRGSVRRGRGGAATFPAPAVTSAPGPEPGEVGPAGPLTPEAAFVAMVETCSRQDVADLLGISKSKVNRIYWRLTRTPEPGPGEAEPEAPGGMADGTAEAVPGPGIRDAGSSAISGPIWSAPEPVLNGSAAHA